MVESFKLTVGPRVGRHIMYYSSAIGGAESCKLTLKFCIVADSDCVQSTKHRDISFHEESCSARRGSVGYSPKCDIISKAVNGYYNVVGVEARR